ncbi:MAG: hypothetical protein ACF8R7_16330, partial [Phycisphaerales bacterium JB039]
MVELTDVAVVGIPRVPVPAVDIIRAEHLPPQRVGVRGGVVGVVDIAIEVDIHERVVAVPAADGGRVGRVV